MIRFFWLSLILLLANAKLVAKESCDKSWQAGAAQADITGPIYDVAMLGYADFRQTSQGLHMRLKSRALYLDNACEQSQLAMVIIDQALFFDEIKQKVLQILAKDLPGLFRHENLMISATHTHSGPGAYAHHILYNITSFGFRQEQFEAITQGIVQSLKLAYERRQPASVSLHRGQIEAQQWNRSLPAYEANPLAEREKYTKPYDAEMQLLKIVDRQGKAIASWNWFPVHGVSLPLHNRLVSGDNKGLSAYLTEKQQPTADFVAGFVQSHSGDVSPYPLTPEEIKREDGYARNLRLAKAQSEAAQALWQSSGSSLHGPLIARWQRLDMADRRFFSDDLTSTPRQTCRAALGLSFAAGTENGRPLPLFREGMVSGRDFIAWSPWPKEQACHQEKILLFPTGLDPKDRVTSRYLPFQLFRLGSLAVLALPFELTTMAGRRLREKLAPALAQQGIEGLVFTALANDYSHYLTTAEEYKEQHYEGASTLFGPHSWQAVYAASQQLVQSLQEKQSPPSDREPPDLSSLWSQDKRELPAARAPFRHQLGENFEPMAKAYRAGQVIEARFWGAPPPSLHLMGKMRLLTVEEWLEGRWQTILDEDSPDTKLIIIEHGLGLFEIKLSWETSLQQATGIYRLCHQGMARGFWQKTSVAYQGCSAQFLLMQNLSARTKGRG